MNIIPLNFAVFGACIILDTEKPFDVKVAYTIARRRLRPEVKSHRTGILSSIVRPGKVDAVTADYTNGVLTIDLPKTGKPTETTSVAIH